MIFGIDQSIINVLSNTQNSNYYDSIILLEKLAESYREGKHLLDLSRGDMKVILGTFDDLSLPARRTYSYIKQYFSLLGIHKHFKRKAVITLNIDKISLKKSHDASQDIYYTPLRFAISNNFFNVNFIVEDITDKDFFSYIAKCVINSNPTLKGLQLNSTFKHGGGDRCSLILEDSCKNHSITISIIDSDRKYPEAALGETASKVNKLKIENSLFEVKFLSVREVENLIPLKFFYLNKNYSGIIDSQISNFYNKNNFYKYFDFKEGLSKNKLLASSKKKKYWDNIFEYDLNLESLKPKFNPNTNQEEKDVLIIRGFGTSILKNFNASTDLNKLSNIISTKKNLSSNPGLEKDLLNLETQYNFFKNPFSELNQELKEEWTNIGMFLLNWTGGFPIHIS